uniref:Hydantoinase B/oxoprolinase domain-containing protein n=1 Tax=Salmo trutta TaxID=8032 RepID=A0A673Y5N7_SALTR
PGALLSKTDCAFMGMATGYSSNSQSCRSGEFHSLLHIKSIRSTIRKGHVILSNHPRTPPPPIFFFHSSKGDLLILKWCWNSGALMALAQYPDFSETCNLHDNLSDLQAQVAANQQESTLVGELIDGFGLTVVQVYMGNIQSNAELAVRDMLKDFVEAEDFMDDGTLIRLRVQINENEACGDVILSIKHYNHSLVVDVIFRAYKVCGAPQVGERAVTGQSWHSYITHKHQDNCYQPSLLFCFLPQDMFCLYTPGGTPLKNENFSEGSVFEYRVAQGCVRELGTDQGWRVERERPGKTVPQGTPAQRV